MLENNEMIYTAIFQNNTGKLTRSRYTGVIDRKEAWKSAAHMGESNGDCLLALVPGDHPVYTYDNTFSNKNADRTNMKTHDVFELDQNGEESVFQMT
mgnify:CR=1 FL=1